MNETVAKSIVNAWLIAQNQVTSGFKRVIVEHQHLRNELLDALDTLNYDYTLTPAKRRDRSFEKPGEVNYKTVWVITLVDKSKVEEQDMM